MSRVISEDRLIATLASLFNYCVNFWADIPNHSLLGGPQVGPIESTDPTGLLAFLAGQDDRSALFLDWLNAGMDQWFLWDSNGRYPTLRFSRVENANHPPPLVALFYGLLDPAMKRADKVIQNQSALILAAYLPQNKNRRRVVKVKHHRYGYVLEAGEKKVRKQPK